MKVYKDRRGEKAKNVNQYFFNCIRNIYVEKASGEIEAFGRVLNNRNKEDSHFYSFFALMGLGANASFNRGTFGVHKRNLVWTEFTFDDQTYVFDSKFLGVMEKEEWSFHHRVNFQETYRRTQQEILEKFLNEEYAIKAGDGIFQFPKIVGDEKLSLENGRIPEALSLARIHVQGNPIEIKNFIGHVE